MLHEINELLARTLIEHLTAINNPSNEIVLSIPAMNFILDMYNRQSMLLNAQLIEEDDLDDKIKEIIDEQRSNPTRKQVQLMVVIDGLHYYPINIYFTDEKPIVFVADYFNEENQILCDLNIQSETLERIHLIACVNSGHERYQNDFNNCGYFALYHLLLSARQNKFSLLPILKRSISDITEDDDDQVTMLSWSDLPVEYMLCAQSFTLLFSSYVNEKTLTRNTDIDETTFNELKAYLEMFFRPIQVKRSTKYNKQYEFKKNIDLSILEMFISGRFVSNKKTKS